MIVLKFLQKGKNKMIWLDRKSQPVRPIPLLLMASSTNMAQRRGGSIQRLQPFCVILNSECVNYYSHSITGFFSQHTITQLCNTLLITILVTKLSYRSYKRLSEHR